MNAEDATAWAIVKLKDIGIIMSSDDWMTIYNIVKEEIEWLKSKEK